jgi:hypothetical protein
MPKSDRFDGIRALIQKGKYDQARVLLQMMPDDPQAQAWLARLNRMSPTAPDPSAANPLDEIDAAQPKRRTQKRPNRTLRRVWLAVRVLSVILLLCQCVWVLPLLNTLGMMPDAVAELDIPVPPVVERSLDLVADSPVGRRVTTFTEETIADPIERASENMQEEVMSQGFQQAAPVLNRMCEGQGLNAQEEALCKDLMGDMQSCLERGSNLDSCLNQVTSDVCREHFGGDAYAYQMCMAQMAELRSLLP